MNDTKELLQRARSQFPPPEDVMESLRRRRDRKRRNQRTAAGVVGIAVFVAAIWIVTSGPSFDRTETPAVPGPAETGPTVTGPAEAGPTHTAPPHAPASATPDKVVRTACGGIAIWRLELTDLGKTIMVRFELHRSLPGRSWWIKIRHIQLPISPYIVEFRGRRVADSNGEFVVQRRVQDFGDAERTGNEFLVQARSPDPEDPPPRGEFSGQGCNEVSVLF